MNGGAATWEKVSTSIAPSPRSHFAMAYGGNGKIVLYGGELDGGGTGDDTWEYDVPSGQWALAVNSSPPGGRMHSAMAYIGAGKVLMFSGTASGWDPRTWIYDVATSQWQDAAPPSGPAGRIRHAMAYDPANDKAVLFSGWTGSARETIT